MYKHYRALLELFDKDLKKKSIILICLMILSTLSELIAISIIPLFIDMLNKQDHIVFLFFDEFINLNQQNPLFDIGLLFCIILMCTGVVKTLNLIFTQKYIYTVEMYLGQLLMKTYINRDYSWFINKDNTELGKNILWEVMEVVNRFVMPLVLLFSNLITIFIIGLAVFIVNPEAMILITCVFLLIYVIIYLVVEKMLGKASKERQFYNNERFSIVGDTFKNIKYIIISNTKPFFEGEFKAVTKKFRDVQSSSQIAAHFPRSVIETFLFLVLIITLMFIPSVNVDSLPQVALFLFAGMRLLPACQQVYFAFSQMKYSGEAVRSYISDVTKLNDDFKIFTEKKILQSLDLKDISYTFPNSKKVNLSADSLHFEKGKMYGVIGKSGSGKTTLIDVISSLVTPQKGSFFIDQNLVKNNQWFTSISYVPQDVKLFKGTMRHNVVGSHERVNSECLLHAVEFAAADDFFSADDDTVLNDNVSPISGGQKQRIGIARAIYEGRKVLILDEATGPLDQETEKRVMMNLSRLKHDKIVIVITHNKANTEFFDSIIKVKDGHCTQSDAPSKI